VSTDVELQYGAQRGGTHVVDEAGGPVAWQRIQPTATTDDSNRGAVVFRADLPALGYRLYRLRPGAVPAGTSPLSASAAVLENDLVRIELDPETGWITSYLHKATGLDVMRGVDGRIHTQVCEDPTDTWGHRVVSYAWPGASMRLDRIVVRETGPLRSRVRVERSWGASTLVEELVLDHDSAVLRGNVTLDWREKGHLLKLRFPTVLTDPAARYEIPFGTIAKEADGAEEPAQAWADATGTVDGRPAGLTVIASNKHAFDVSPGAQPSIGITATRSPVYSWHDPRLLDRDGVYSYQDQGMQRFSYELVPHGGDWRAAQPTRRAILLGSPVRAMLESSHPGRLPAVHSFASDGGGAVLVTAIKGSEDAPPLDTSAGVGAAGADMDTGAPDADTRRNTDTADLIVRAVETRGEAAVARIELPVVGRVLEERFGPSQIRTFRVPRDPSRPVVEVDLLERPLDPGA
jgi:alpha-mannosidase